MYVCMCMYVCVCIECMSYSVLGNSTDIGLNMKVCSVCGVSVCIYIYVCVMYKIWLCFLLGVDRCRVSYHFYFSVS